MSCIVLDLLWIRGRFLGEEKIGRRFHRFHRFSFWVWLLKLAHGFLRIEIWVDFLK